LTVSNSPRVPFNPQPIEVLQARYAAAVKDTIDALAVYGHQVPAPSGDPAHVFDTPLGLRLIISRERLLDGRIGVHLSASWEHGVPDNAKLESLLADIYASFKAISRTTQTPELIAVTTGGIPHFFVEQTH
jgi:hypothetical protein